MTKEIIFISIFLFIVILIVVFFLLYRNRKYGRYTKYRGREIRREFNKAFKNIKRKNK